MSAKKKAETTKPSRSDAPICSDCGGSGLGNPMYRPEIDKTQRDRCYTCRGTGKTRSEHDQAWEKSFVVPIAKTMKQRGIGYMVICIRDDGKAAYVLEPNTPDDATVDALIRHPNS